MELHQAVTVDGKQNEKVLLFASLNASMQSGYTNPLDEAVLHKSKTDHSSWKKLDELPYDFCRKRITILAQKKGEDPLLISKGAFVQMMGICSKIELEDGTLSPLASHQKELEEKFQEYSKKGSRVLAVAYLPTPAKTTLKRGEEKEMIFLGFLLFVDPIKKGVGTTIAKLKEAGIDLKLITGDNRFVAEHVSREIGLLEKEVVLGDEIAQLDEQALAKKVSEYKVFAEVEPNQKERLLLSLKKSGVVTGYLGDGINDVTALHIADVGISVNSSVDVVKEEADIVLLKKDLSALLTGVEEGRRTFANTMKYIFMATSANFGNMFSMAGASLTLSFLPLLPKQILLINFLTDFPEIAIATDKVDEEMVKKPLRWDIKFIRKFMITFGLISSFFDFSTYLVLIFLLRSNMEQFRTGWFIESVVSAALIVLAVRTRRPFFTSMPSIYLLTGVVLVIALACLAPLTPLAPLFNFVPLPSLFYLVVSGIVLAYFLSVELAKLLFYRKNPC
jgi:Mg2+-importing ATPase